MIDLKGKRVTISLGNGLTLNGDSWLNGIIRKTVRCSTGALFAVDTDVGVMLLALRYDGNSLADLGGGKLVVHVACYKGDSDIDDLVPDHAIRQVGPGVARLVE